MEGVIDTIIRAHGFGFIRTGDGREIFFHRSSLLQLDFGSLKEGEAVEFDVRRGEDGPRAVHVRAAADSRSEDRLAG